MYKIVLLLLFSINVYALNSFTYPWIIKANDTVTYTKWKGNNDSIKACSDRIVDTVNRGVVHFNSSSLNHDSTVKFVNIDTVKLVNKTTNKALKIDANNKIDTSVTTSAELALLSGKNSVIDGSGTSGTVAGFSGSNRLTNSPITYSTKKITVDTIKTVVDSTTNLFVGGSITGTNTIGLQLKSAYGVFAFPITSDGADNRYVTICGGGSVTSVINGSPSSGAQINAWGNESSLPGGIQLIPGNGNGTTTGKIQLAGSAYFGTRPSDDNYWNLALGKWFTFLGQDNNESYIMHNAGYSSGWKYRESDGNGASLLQFAGNYAMLRFAPTGTKDSAITWKQNIRLDTMGIGIGKTPTAPLDVAGLVKADSLRVAGKVTSVRDSTSDLIATDSVKGVTGTFTDVVQVDSLKSTKGISTNARITGTDIDVSDSVKGVTGTFTGNIAAATLNTGNGANELYAMDQNVRTSDNVDFADIGTDWINYSNSTTLTGWSTIYTKNIYYKKIGQIVFVYFYIDGVSNSTAARFTLPFNFRSNKALCTIEDNGGSYNVGSITPNSDGTVYGGTDLYTVDGFTASGEKKIFGTLWAITY